MVLGSSNFVSDTSCAWKCEKLDISSKCVDLRILHVFTTFALFSQFAVFRTVNHLGTQISQFLFV